jgi:hypothetical protein
MNSELIQTIVKHFNDGPSIPGLIEDAIKFFDDLHKAFPDKVRRFAFELYPTYSFYKFDDQLFVAMYPTTAAKRDVPTFRWSTDHPFAQFILADLTILLDPSNRRM